MNRSERAFRLDLRSLAGTSRAAIALAAILGVGSGCQEEPRARTDGRSPFKPVTELIRSATLALRCPGGGWPIYAHDAQRSGATLGCCRGPVTPLWHFEPPAKPPRKARLHHAIVSKDAVYASGAIGESPAVFALTLAGKLLWTFDSHVDITRFEWPAYALDRVILNDDGLYILDPRTGETEVDRGLDSWGQVLDDGRNLFASNTWYVAGPKTYVGALEAGGAPLWKRHEFGVTKEDVMDRLGGIALAGGHLVFSASYAHSPGSGVYAHETKDGEAVWSAETVPKSHASVAGETVYSFERPEHAAAESLVARNSETGATRWSVKAETRETAPPVVAAGKLLHRDPGGALLAVHRGDGTADWSTKLAPPESTDVRWATSFAVATGSSTAVAVDGQVLVVLSLDDGSLLWRGPPGELKGPFHSPVLAAGRLYLVDGTGLGAFACAP